MPLLWCFPATPIELVRQFIATLTGSPRRIVVLGSTSAYDLGDSQAYPPPWIDETAPINLTKPRVQGEEYLRLEQGASCPGKGRTIPSTGSEPAASSCHEVCEPDSREDLAAIFWRRNEAPGEVTTSRRLALGKHLLDANSMNAPSLQTAAKQEAGNASNAVYEKPATAFAIQIIRRA
jgi:hypothetical protein